jgi:hydrogenase maturation protease
VPEAVAAAAAQLAAWGFPGRPRAADEVVEPLNAQSIDISTYEAGRPDADDACRVGDERLLARRKGA